MRNLKRQGGFTLIEMVIVIAVVGVLMGLAFNGIRGVQSAARDTKRVADLKSMKSYLELYFNKCGHYPGDEDCVVQAIDSNFETMSTALTSTGTLGEVAKPGDIPIAPPGTDGYFYSSSANNLDYVLYAEMERIPGGGVEGPNVVGEDCDPTDARRRYCVTN